MQLHAVIYGAVGCYNNQIRKGLLLSLSVIFLNAVNIWQEYKQEFDCLVHFLRLLAVCWPGAQSARDNYALACNFAKYSPIFNFFCTHRLSNKHFLICLLTTPSHLKHVATLTCNLLLMVYFADINVSQGSVRSNIGKVPWHFKYPFNQKFTQKSSSEFFFNWFIFDRIMVMPTFLPHPVNHNVLLCCVVYTVVSAVS